MGQKPDGRLNYSGFSLSDITLSSRAGWHKNFHSHLALITIITVVTVTLLSRSAAMRNPVDSISNE